MSTQMFTILIAFMGAVVGAMPAILAFYLRSRSDRHSLDAD